jgi:hypothetical protein
LPLLLTTSPSNRPSPFCKGDRLKGKEEIIKGEDQSAIVSSLIVRSVSPAWRDKTGDERIQNLTPLGKGEIQSPVISPGFTLLKKPLVFQKEFIFLKEEDVNPVVEKTLSYESSEETTKLNADLFPWYHFSSTTGSTLLLKKGEILKSSRRYSKCNASIGAEYRSGSITGSTLLLKKD